MNLHTTLRSRVMMTLLALATLTTGIFSSCKKTNNDGAKFVGTYIGHDYCSGATSLTILPGSDGSQVKISQYSLGSSSGCLKDAVFTMGASGNTISGRMSFTDACGTTFDIITSGSLNGNTLTFRFTQGGGTASGCTFIGTK